MHAFGALSSYALSTLPVTRLVLPPGPACPSRPARTLEDPVRPPRFDLEAGRPVRPLETPARPMRQPACC